MVNIYQCRRKKQIKANDDRKVVPDLVTYDERKEYELFDGICKGCGYGAEHNVLIEERPPFNYKILKTCRIRIVTP